MLGVSMAAPEEAARPIRAVVTRPKTVNDAREICDHVRHGRLCIVDITGVSKEDSQRIADFLGGVCHGVGGETVRISGGIFVIAPPSHRLISDSGEPVGHYGESSYKASSGG